MHGRWCGTLNYALIVRLSSLIVRGKNDSIHVFLNSTINFSYLIVMVAMNNTIRRLGDLSHLHCEILHLQLLREIMSKTLAYFLKGFPSELMSSRTLTFLSYRRLTKRAPFLYNFSFIKTNYKNKGISIYKIIKHIQPDLKSRLAGHIGEKMRKNFAVSTHTITKMKIKCIRL